jgi:hypothetical protein
MTRAGKMLFGIVHACGALVGIGGLLAAILLAGVVLTAALGTGSF